MLGALLPFKALPSELSLVFAHFSLLNQDGVVVAYGKVEEGKLLSLFCRVNLVVVGALQ